jgi:GNAT superfamily N-acetyltransferase
MRVDYPGFDAWFEKCKRQHRDCWVLEIGKEIAGLVIRKDENHAEAGTSHLGPKILKICTFKVEDEFQGEKFGELLLKQVLWFAQRNNYDLAYVTAYPKHAFLIDLLEYYGFRPTIKLPNGEAVFEKPIARGALPPVTEDIFHFDRAH